MRSLLITTIIAAVTFSGCDRWKAPQGQAEQAAQSSAAISAESEAEVSPDAPDPAYVKSQLATEKSTIAAHPGLAVRTGDTLTISYDGKAVASFTAPYVAWVFAGTIKVADAEGKSETLAVVYHNGGEIGWHYIVRRDGTVVALDDEILISPDGRFIASGYGGTDWDSQMRVAEWNGAAYPRIVIFKANCSPVAWQDKDHFTAACTREEDDAVMMLAKVGRDAAGQWHLDETAQRQDDNKDYPTQPGIKLRHEVAQPDASTLDSDTRDAVQNGYRRLAGS